MDPIKPKSSPKTAAKPLPVVDTPKPKAKSKTSAKEKNQAALQAAAKSEFTDPAAKKLALNADVPSTGPGYGTPQISTSKQASTATTPSTSGTPINTAPKPSTTLPSNPLPGYNTPAPTPHGSGPRGGYNGPVTDPTVGDGDGAGGAGLRFRGPIQGPPLPYTQDEKEAIAAALKGDYGPVAKQIADKYLTGAYPASIERAVLPDLIRDSASMPSADRDVMLSAALREPDAAQALVQLFATSGYQKLTEAQKTWARSIVSKAGYEGIRDLADIFFKDPKRLLAPVPDATSEGVKGRNVLSELARLANAGVNPVFHDAKVTTQDAVDSLLSDIANPRDIFQGQAGTCTVTSMQYDLVSKEPGEYARIIADLATNGHSTLRGDSDSDGKRDELELQTEYLNPNPKRDARRLSEVWFQSAAMELANGDLDYDADQDLNFNRRGLTEYGDTPFQGLYGDQQQKMLEAVFDVDYTMYNAADPKDYLDVLRAHPADSSAFPILLNLEFQGDFQKPGGTTGPVTDPTVNRGGGSHAVTFDSVQTVGNQERVYFRDPWGKGEAMPPAQWDDQQGMYFMTDANFEKSVQRLHVAVETLDGTEPAFTRYEALDPEKAMAPRATGGGGGRERMMVNQY